MPDEAKAGYSWPQGFRDAIQVFQIVALAWIAHLGASTRTDVGDVRNTQTVVKEDLQEKIKKENRVNEIKLYEAWRNLEWIAQDSGKQSDKDKASQAKKIYDEFVNHNGN